MVKQKHFWKSAFKAIFKNISRFLAMISITMLSSGIITGLLVTAPNMKKTVSEQYEIQKTPDIELISSIGFDDDSIEIFNEYYDYILPVLKSDKTIESKVASKSGFLTTQTLTAQIFEFSSEYENLSNIEVIEGNYPKNEFEVLVERDTYHFVKLTPGDELIIEGITYTVSGIVKNMWYYSLEAERSLQTGDTYQAIVYKSRGNIDYYSSVFVTVDKEKGLDHFSKKYTNLINDEIKFIEENVINKVVETRLENLLANLPPIMHEEIIKRSEGLYILSRSSNQSYQTFKMLIEKVDAITKIFPIFFLIVSILVVLTTMTRMIEEERGEIGVIRSIGYTKTTIYRKYILYGFLTALIGVIAGYLAGFRLIPTIINNAFKTIFHLDDLNLNIYSTENIIYILVIIISIVLTSILSVRKTMKQSPAEMLIKKSPKVGKRIFLEKIPFIWNRLKFKYKSSLRNLFRYPKHLLMTVIGVSGSLALVFTGLSLTDSVDAIGRRQYEDIFNYQLSIHVNDKNEDLNNYLENENLVYTLTMQQVDILRTVKSKEDFYINIVVFESSNDFINFRNRKTNKKLYLDDHGVIITEQISKYLEVKENDYLKIKDNNEVLVKGITENYLENYIYMTKSYYESLSFHDESTNFYLLVKGDISNQDVLKREIIKFDNVLSMNFVNDDLIAKTRQLNQVLLLAIVIVVAAVFLQVVIIYNLTNVNISERDKELSTLKVLGYHNKEVSNYIYREINMMTGFGIIIGLPLGFLLQRYVITMIDSPNIMMGRNINWYTYLISISLTIIMTIIVEVFMHFKIKKIDMISALKEL